MEPSEAKRQVADAILDKSLMHVHLDPRRAGVVVPAHLAAQAGLVLAVGRKGLHIPIPDLVVDARGIRATLSFEGKPFLCELPWTAVYALVDTDKRGKVWKEDMPPDLPPASEESWNYNECSFCLAPRDKVGHLVAGDSVSICDECIKGARPPRWWERVLRLFGFGRRAAPRGTVSMMPYRDPVGAKCSFCHDAPGTAARGSKACICAACLALADEVLAERKQVRRAPRVPR